MTFVGFANCIQVVIVSEEFIAVVDQIIVRDRFGGFRIAIVNFGTTASRNKQQFTLFHDLLIIAEG
ncbi:hypothetical protein D3C83_252290 [compost metagenome]